MFAAYGAFVHDADGVLTHTFPSIELFVKNLETKPPIRFTWRRLEPDNGRQVPLLLTSPTEVSSWPPTAIG
ncbi:hypothetical protein DIJ64_06205 [Mycobacterium leprae]|uniref:Uncharacterized protein n=1 Tax=Mycobacterium leprae TaxID=1769 RepID=A0AAD0P8G0_MYCLR|nr:hypothetical protein DIJ64_06205 [Mycobacterium leprae]OAR19661.1 hypothetical protein A8144_04335 [Mycobacterium leprae 3125609]OAX71830.1 hypothetical protein A3216_03335 [Mycobacterium leprae 7935681]